MRVFLLTFFALYGGMNGYLYWKLIRGCVFGLTGRIVLAGFLLLMVCGPLLLRFLDRGGHFLSASILAWVVYPWMAVALWFLCVGVLGDIWNLSLRAVALWAPSAKALIVPPKPVLAATAVVIVVLLTWGLIEACAIRGKELTFTVPQLPPGTKPIRIAVLSDLHLGVTTGPWRFARAMRIIQSAAPDAIISLGDLLDSNNGNVESFVRRLAALNPPLGKYAIFGNHEMHSGPEESLEFHRLAGFQVLRGRSVQLVPGVRLAGLDDPAFFNNRREELAAEAAALAEGPDDYVILLKHRPEVTDAQVGRFMLQLSGHTHGGQFFPFLLITANQFRYYTGLHPLDHGAAIYVSKGTGTWGPPLRVLAPPEVTLITLLPTR